MTEPETVETIRMIVIYIAAIKTISTQDENGFTDENRPYEFGFNIEGYQHRHEKKDEKGIIMGEFGFITGDGVYHLTVYATDENGNFKILKMKNTYIGLPMEKATTPVPPVASVTTPRLRQITAGTPQLRKLTGGAACSGCLIPNKITPEKDGFNKVEPISNTAAQLHPNSGISDRGREDIGLDVRSNPGGPFVQQHNLSPPTKAPRPILKNIEPKVDNLLNKNNFGNNKPGKPFNTFTGDRKKDKTQNNLNTKYNYKTMNISDLMAILYKFNYTLTYHGHNEIGNRAGEKNGSYFFNGRDGFGRDVKYIANEYGYQPNITLVELNINDTPKEETEKVLTKLLGNEFIWYY